MIKYLSEKIAAYIAANDKSADYELLVYGYDVLLQEVGVVLITLVLALLAGLFLEILTALVCYNLLRYFAGGVHAKHRAVCITSSVLILFAPAFLFGKMHLCLSLPAILVLYAADLVLLLLYAPADTEMKPIQSSDKRRNLKFGACIALTVFFAAAALLLGSLPVISSIVAVTATFVSVFTHPWVYKLYGCEKSEIKKMEAES